MDATDLLLDTLSKPKLYSTARVLEDWLEISCLRYAAPHLDVATTTGYISMLPDAEPKPKRPVETTK